MHYLHLLNILLTLSIANCHVTVDMNNSTISTPALYRSHFINNFASSIGKQHQRIRPFPPSLTVIREDPSDVELISKTTEKDVNTPAEYEPYYPTGSYPNDPNHYDPLPQGPNTHHASSSDLQAFTARRAIVTGGSKKSRIRFVDTITQLGTGWRPATSEFVCESPGYFFFTFSSCGQQYAHFRVTLKHNEFGVISSFGDRNGYEMATNGVVLFLRTNDRVFLELNEGLLYEVNTQTGRAYNTFSGFRIL